MKSKKGKQALYIPDLGSVSGYASTWIRRADAAGDVVRRGAFRESVERIMRDKKTIPFLFNHQHDNINSYIGRVIELEEDEHGLFFVAEFDDTKEAQRARQLVKDGRITGFSFAYNTLDEGPVTLPDGSRANELRKLELLEISLVMYPANRDTSVIEVKSFDDMRHERREDQKKRRLLRTANRLLKEATRCR